MKYIIYYYYDIANCSRYWFRIFDRQDHTPVLFILCKPIYFAVCFAKHEAHPNIIINNYLFIKILI